MSNKHAADSDFLILRKEVQKSVKECMIQF